MGNLITENLSERTREGNLERTQTQATTSLLHHATESSVCERNMATGLSTQASVDSASLLVSESADVPDQSCSSDDLCSLEVQGSDLSPYMTLCTSCTSPEHSTRSRARSHANMDLSESSIMPDSITCSLENVVAPEKDERSITTKPSTESKERVSKKLTLPVPPVPEVQACASDAGALPSPSGRPRGARLCFSIWSPSSTSVAHPSSTSARTLRAKRYRKLARIVRSTSDPVSCNSVHRPDSCSCTSTAFMELSGGTASQCAKHSGRGAKKQKDCGKADLCLKARTLHSVPSERPHSLADLQTYKDTKILVARFLEHSSCSLPPEVQQVVNSIKCVIKSDEKHMEEAMFSASILDQVMSHSQPITSSLRKHTHDDLHLQSCGALSSPSLRRCNKPRVSGQTEADGDPGRDLPQRPKSLISVCRETIL